MSDVAVEIIDNCFQISIENGDLKADEGLETAVLISLFSDQRVTEEELPPGILSKKGWWADLFPMIEGDQIGSKVWALDREKNTLETVANLETRVKEALQWMIEDGVASQINVEAELSQTDNSRSDVLIEIVRPTGNTDRFGVVWDAQTIKRA